MKQNILILGTLDTKSEQIRLLCERIKQMGHTPLLMDLSLGHLKEQWADFSSDELIKSIGEDIQTFRASKDRKRNGEIMVIAAKGQLPNIIREYQVAAIGAMGGVSMATMACKILEIAPFGLPKAIMVTAAMPSYVKTWFGSMDVFLFQCIIEFNGINMLVEHAISLFAGCLCGLASTPKLNTESLPYPSIAITELGFSQKCAHYVRTLLEQKGFQVYSFHAQGISDRKLEELLRTGYFDGVIDIAAGGLIEELYGGSRAAGLERLDYLSQRSIPKILAPAALNITNANSSSLKELQGRKLLPVDDLRAYVRYSVTELRRAARLYAQKLNKAVGPTVFVFPKKGWSSLDREGSPLYDPEVDGEFIEELRSNLVNKEVQLIELDCNLEDKEFAQFLVQSLSASFLK